MSFHPFCGPVTIRGGKTRLNVEGVADPALPVHNVHDGAMGMPRLAYSGRWAGKISGSTTSISSPPFAFLVIGRDWAGGGAGACRALLLLGTPAPIDQLTSNPFSLFCRHNLGQVVHLCSSSSIGILGC